MEGKEKILKNALELYSILEPGVSLNAMVDIMGKDTFYELLNSYGGLTITFPSYEELNQNNLVTDSIPLDVMAEILDTDIFHDVLNVYRGCTISIPTYNVVRQNELLLASKDIIDKDPDIDWVGIKDHLDITKKKGYKSASNHFSSISFARRINSLSGNEKDEVRHKFNAIVESIKSLNMTENDWNNFFNEDDS